MPVVIVEGICRPHCSHAAANLEKMSSLAMYDLDHCGQRTAEIKALICRLPYVTYAHNSISDEGLKIIVYLDVNTPEEYPLAYAICQQTLQRIAGHPCDEQCARITQPCSCVWDPDAYYNPAPEPYPWREELATDPSLAQLVHSPPIYICQRQQYPLPHRHQRQVLSHPAPHRSLRIYRSLRPHLLPVPPLAERKPTRIHARLGKKRTT
ncbi:BT4734/BF3469 family protein [Bacteroides congonensis]